MWEDVACSPFRTPMSPQERRWTPVQWRREEFPKWWCQWQNLPSWTGYSKKCWSAQKTRISHALISALCFWRWMLPCRERCCATWLTLSTKDCALDWAGATESSLQILLGYWASQESRRSFGGSLARSPIRLRYMTNCEAFSSRSRDYRMAQSGLTVSTASYLAIAGLSVLRPRFRPRRPSSRVIKKDSRNLDSRVLPNHWYMQWAALLRPNGDIRSEQVATRPAISCAPSLCQWIHDRCGREGCRQGARTWWSHLWSPIKTQRPRGVCTYARVFQFQLIKVVWTEGEACNFQWSQGYVVLSC